MSFLGNSSKKNSSTTNNNASEAQQDSNQGFILNGDLGGGKKSNTSLNITQTDHGAVASGAAISQSALAANIESTRMALDATSTTNIHALDSVTGFGESVIDKLNNLSTKVLVNGEKATRGAMELAKSATTSEAASITQLMLKAGLVLGAIAIIGAVVVRGKK